MRWNRARLATVALVVLVVLAGCSGAGGGGGGDSGDGGGETDLSTGGEAPEASGDGGGGGGDSGPEQAASASFSGGEQTDLSGPAVERAIIRTGTVTVEVESFENASATVAELVAEQGGFVAGSERTVHGEGNRSWTTGYLVLRVPSENFSAVFEGAGAVGTVESATSDTEDVTDQLVDLNARIDNLEAQRDRLRTLYDRANETQDVLEVGRELSEVQGELERLEAKRRALRERVALSTITVRLHEPRPDRPAIERTAFHEVGLISAFLDSVDGVVVALRTIVVAIAYATPYLLVFGLPLVGLAALVYRRR
ncbi:MAG: DUF4349 domain-containing protein [Halobacteriales archaeon]|nr:DUF4349 domain-containing protein [Halobacteriales archaeon]